MAVKYTLVHSDTTSTPNDSAAATFSFGDNIPGGPIDSIVVRMTATVATGSVVADYSNMISALRFTLNGEVVHDFRAGYSGGSNNAPGLYGYFLNSIGGRFSERPSDTAKEAYLVIPVGRQVATGVGRLEVVLSYAASATAVSAGGLQMWGRYNDATQTMTTVSPSTSFTHAASIEQVVVRIPQNVPGAVAGILVQNDTASDELGTEGIRLMAQSQYGLDPDFIRLFNGDLANGIIYADDDLSTTAQSFAFEVPGALFIPAYNLTGGDVVLQVDSSAATTRTYTPVMVAAFNAKEGPGVKQTARVVGNTSAAIIAKTE
jgi:hypothetical protein